MFRDDPPRVLLVTASPRGEDSFSLPLAEAVVEGLTQAAPAEVDRLDAFTDLQPFGAPQAAAKMAVVSRTPVPARVTGEWQRVLEVAARLQAADDIVLAVPMWNGGIPWALKLFIDVVTQPGIAFRFDPRTGYHGLLDGRRAVAAYTSRVYAPGVEPAFGVDHQSTYLRWWLGLCGIDEVHEVRLQPTYTTPDLEERRLRALAEARDLGARLAGARRERAA